jgi:hypothetical protein
MASTLTARSLKVVLVLDPAAVAQIPVEPTTARVDVQIQVGARTVTAALTGKSVRKAVASVREHGVDNVVATSQGKLEADDVLAEAGLSVMVKAPKPAANEVAA